MQGGWQPPPGGGGYGPPGGAYGTPPGTGPTAPSPPGYGGPAGYGHPPPGFQPNPYAGAHGMMPGQPAATYGNYEFNEYENSIIDKTASRAKLWGWISTVLGATQIIGGTCGALFSGTLVTYLPFGIVMLVVGITFIGVGNSLKNVVTTQGNDLLHLMTALQKLGSAFLIQAIAYIVTVILVMIAVVLMFFVFAVAAAAGS